jgi:hypothetical protein
MTRSTIYRKIVFPLEGSETSVFKMVKMPSKDKNELIRELDDLLIPKVDS